MDVDNVEAQLVPHLLHDLAEYLGLGDERDPLGAGRDGGVGGDAGLAGANVVGEDDAALEGGQPRMQHLNVGELGLHPRNSEMRSFSLSG